MNNNACIVNRESCILSAKGITLIELLIVLVIIGMIVLFATIDVSWFMRETRVSETRDRLVADIEDMKLKSLTQIPHGIIVTGGNNTNYRLVTLTAAAGADFRRDSPADNGSIINDPSVSINPVNLPLNVRVELVGAGGDELWFDRKGVPRTEGWATLGRTLLVWYDVDGNGTLPWADSNASGNLDLESECQEPCKLIIISNNGRIQYEKR